MRFKLITKILLLAVVLSLSALTSLAKAYEVRDFVFELQDNKVKITDYIGSETELVIPQYLDGFEVTVIGESALNNKGLQHVTLPDSVKVIEESAFASNAISYVSFPESLAEIKSGAFSGNLIQTLNLPSSLEIVGEGAFARNQLRTVYYDAQSTDIDFSSFETQSGQLSYISNSKNFYFIIVNDEAHVTGTSSFCNNGSYMEFPDGIHVDYIGKFAPLVAIHEFWLSPRECGDVHIIIPNSVKYIGKNAFGILGSPGYTGIKNVDLGQSVEIIDDYAFSGLNLNSVIIPNSVKYIGKDAFASNDIENLNLGNSIETIAHSAFQNNQLSSITIPASVQTIGDLAFENNRISSVIIPSGVIEIGVSAFQNNQLSSITIPASVQTIGDLAFENNRISSVIIPSGVIEIGVSAFQNNQLSSITIPASVQTIGDYAFKSNYISELNLEQSQADIGVEAFRDNQISQVTIPETIGDIASDVFYGNQITDVNHLGGGAEFYFIGDSDQDGVFDVADAFPFDASETADFDGDGIGNNTDTDDDNDGYTDFLDAFPTDATEWADSDLDGIGNNSDYDDDNDGVADTEDAFPHTASESLDSDNDGVGDNADAFPNDATEVADTDLDGIGNNADPDDDNDGVADADDGDPLNADIGIQPSQLISVAGNPVGVNGHSTRISLSYDTSDGNNQLPGIGFRLHYSSEMLSFAGTENTIANDIIVDGDGPYQDDSDYDNDSNTDKYIIFGWAALNGDWPNSSLPASLVDVVFNVSWEAFDQASITTPINFSKVSTTEGYNFEATNYTLNVLPATWDFDGNGQADALTDGLILLRHAFGVRGASLTDSVMATDSTMTSDEVQVAVEKALVIADVDGDGNVDALTDGLIVLRYMFGLTGETLMDGVVSANATRASAESVQEHIELYMPNNLLPPVQSEQSFIVGDWKLADIPEQREYVGGILSDWNASIWGYDQVLFETCVEDDIYRFGETGSFEYLINGSTYMNDEMNPLFNYGSANSYCDSPLAPWNESDIYTYSFDENNSLLTVTGYGAYIALAHVANGTDGIEHGADAPESITYSYTKILENQILLEIDAYDRFYRFTLEKVVN